jgi:hypothetical protein
LPWLTLLRRALLRGYGEAWRLKVLIHTVKNLRGPASKMFDIPIEAVNTKRQRPQGKGRVLLSFALGLSRRRGTLRKMGAWIKWAILLWKGDRQSGARPTVALGDWKKKSAMINPDAQCYFYS